MTSVYVDIPVHDLVIGLGDAPHEVVKSAILDLDSYQSNTNFTMDLIKSLIETLREELDKDEMKDFIKTLRKK